MNDKKSDPKAKPPQGAPPAKPGAKAPENKAQNKPATAPTGSGPQAPAPAASAQNGDPAAATGLSGSEKEALLQQMIALERENKSIRGQIQTCSPELVGQLKTSNKELKKKLLDAEKQYLALMIERKSPLDLGAALDQLGATRAGILEYLKSINADEALYKKVESL